MRYGLGFGLAVVVAATACAGHDEVAAQAQWAADAPAWVLRALGAKPDPLTGTISTPSEVPLHVGCAHELNLRASRPKNLLFTWLLRRNLVRKNLVDFGKLDHNLA